MNSMRNAYGWGHDEWDVSRNDLYAGWLKMRLNPLDEELLLMSHNEFDVSRNELNGVMMN